MSSRCRSCGARILWATTESGRSIPLDPRPEPDGNIVLSVPTTLNVDGRPEGAPVATVLSPAVADEQRASGRQPLYRSHFASCPDASQHRRERR